jgi:nitroreductase
VYFDVQDYAAAIENMLLAITALGYASCWVEGYITGNREINEKMAASLGVPASYELMAYLPIGIPAEKSGRAGKKPFEQRAWFNGFK